MLYQARYIALRQKLIQTRVRAGIAQLQLTQSLRKVQSLVSKVDTDKRYLDVLSFIIWCEAVGANAEDVLRKIKMINP